MEAPDLVRHGLSKSYETGYNSEANHMLYKHIKKSPEEISVMIRETWDYMKKENKNNHVICHFLYLLENEVEREWVNDISIDIIQYGLGHSDIEVVDRAIGLIESWNDKDLLDLLYNTEIKADWLHKYKMDVLKDFDYFK